jgi:hypothetical protein
VEEEGKENEKEAEGEEFNDSEDNEIQNESDS